MGNTEWHLSKTFNIGLIVALAGMLISGSIAWANMERDILSNTERSIIVNSDISIIKQDVKYIREGLIAEGIIKVK